MKSTRRKVLQGAGFLSAAPLSMLGMAAKTTGGVYSQLGLRPVINCRGTHTVLGASKMWPDLHEAMAEASRQYVVLDELDDKVAARLAELIGCEVAMVTTGCAGANTLGAAACLTGTDARKVRQLPDVTGM